MIDNIKENLEPRQINIAEVERQARERKDWKHFNWLAESQDDNDDGDDDDCFHAQLLTSIQ